MHTRFTRASSECIYTRTNLFGGPLESSNHRVLNLVEVLHTLADVNDHVGSCPLGTKAPDLATVSRIPLILLREQPGSGLGVILRSDFTLQQHVAGDSKGVGWGRGGMGKGERQVSAR